MTVERTPPVKLVVYKQCCCRLPWDAAPYSHGCTERRLIKHFSQPQCWCLRSLLPTTVGINYVQVPSGSLSVSLQSMIARSRASVACSTLRFCPTLPSVVLPNAHKPTFPFPAPTNSHSLWTYPSWEFSSIQLLGSGFNSNFVKYSILAALQILCCCTFCITWR